MTMEHVTRMSRQALDPQDGDHLALNAAAFYEYRQQLPPFFPLITEMARPAEVPNFMRGSPWALGAARVRRLRGLGCLVVRNCATKADTRPRQFPLHDASL